MPENREAIFPHIFIDSKLNRYLFTCFLHLSVIFLGCIYRYIYSFCHVVDNTRIIIYIRQFLQRHSIVYFLVWFDQGA
jgi:hypothetical protein